jgi:cytoskeleton protein RodZ
MNLEQFGERLKQARIEKHISLMDVSSETRINVKFLEALELGHFHLLPQTYVRAFLREFALMVGLDPAEIMREYDAARLDVPSRKSEDGATQTVQEKSAQGNIEQPRFSLSSVQRNVLFGVFILAALALIVVLANLNRGPETAKPVAEVSFDKVVRESEAASIPPPSAVVDSFPAVIEPKIDSLYLQITTHDSVWISLLIDGKKGAAYLFGPKRKYSWVAKERFAVTMGNAGGATFELNGKDIGALGKRGAIVRNTILTEATLKN